MADFVDATVKDIDTRLAELKEEVVKLEAARTALLGSRRGPGRPKGSTNGSASATASSSGSGSGSGSAKSQSRRRGPGRPRGRRGGNTRANQALELVRSNPGITIPQIAESLKIEPNYLYRVLPKLVSDGQVKRDGAGWYPAETQAASES
ncbi:MAG: winged helix-turn-helix transcriptional regulator [Solirubrobacterales bacterium]|nr:winged helix-turn-helix transcriptional regulator [Solirubrobacterales bacterium]